jgi:hypothetical protein
MNKTVSNDWLLSPMQQINGGYSRDARRTGPTGIQYISRFLRVWTVGSLFVPPKFALPILVPRVQQQLEVVRDLTQPDESPVPPKLEVELLDHP